MFLHRLTTNNLTIERSSKVFDDYQEFADNYREALPTTREEKFQDSSRSGEMNTSSATVQFLYPSIPKWQKVFDFIESNFHLPIGLQEVAKEFDYSPAYLTNQIGRATEKSVGKWLQERRMQEAYQLLLTTDKPVVKIAHEVGFQTLGHFFKVFKKKYGKSPQTLRVLSTSRQTAKFTSKNNL